MKDGLAGSPYQDQRMDLKNKPSVHKAVKKCPKLFFSCNEKGYRKEEQDRMKVKTILKQFLQKANFFKAYSMRNTIMIVFKFIFV